MRKNNKKGVSPVIATILLISMVLIIGFIIFMWASGMFGDIAMKRDKNIKLVCDEIKFTADYFDGKLNIVNQGNIPIFRLNIILYGAGGSYQTKDITELSSEWPDVGLRQDEIFSGSIGEGISEGDRIKVIPVLIGKSGASEKIYICEEQYGYEVEA